MAKKTPLAILKNMVDKQEKISSNLANELRELKDLKKNTRQIYKKMKDSQVQTVPFPPY